VVVHIYNSSTQRAQKGGLKFEANLSCIARPRAGVEHLFTTCKALGSTPSTTKKEKKRKKKKARFSPWSLPPDLAPLAL
jgi:hypothetical protein